jgi:AAA family ATP:ADP antiporter
MEKENEKGSIRKLFDFRKEERPVVLLMFIFFFTVITVFQLLRPIKKGLFVSTLGADLELYAKLLNIATSAVAVVVFSFLVNKLKREKVVYVLAIFFILTYGFLAYVLSLKTPPTWSIWTFYLAGDLHSTMLVAAFWAYLTDISNSDQAKRLYGAIGAGGVIGGWFGASIAKLLLKQIGTSGLLMVAAGLTAALIMVVYWAEKLVDRSASFGKGGRPLSEKGEAGVGAALEGAKLALRSKYLAAVVGMMLFYEIGSQINDYQFSKFAESLSGTQATQSYFANVSFFANGLAVVVQLFLVSLIMRRAGLTVALLVLPLALLISSLTFMLIPTLLFASFLFISDNGLNYSVQQTSRETLYVVTTPDEKYKARAFTSMFVQRVAKGLAIFAVLGLGVLGLTGTSVRFLSILTMLVMTVLIVLSIYAGRRFAEKSKAQELETKRKPIPA